MGVRLEVGLGLGGRNYSEKEKEEDKTKSSTKKSSQCRKMVEGPALTRKSHLKVVSLKKKI